MVRIPRNDVTRYWWHENAPLWTRVAAGVGIVLGVSVAILLNTSPVVTGAIAVLMVVLAQVAWGLVRRVRGHDS